MAGLKCGRLYPVILVIITLVSSIAAYALGARSAEKSAEMYRDELIGRFGAVTECVDPDLAEKMALAYTGAVTEKNIASGEAYLERFGYSSDMPDVLLGGSNELKTDMGIRNAAIIIIAVISVTITFLFMIKAYSNKLREIVSDSDCILHSRQYREDGQLNGALRICSGAFAGLSDKISLLENKLSEQDGFIRRLISDISHQMRTPVAAIRINTEIILSDKDMPRETILDFLERSLSQTDRLEWLISGLLKSARLDSGETQFELDPHSLREAADDALTMYSEQAEKKHITIENTIPENIILTMDIRWLSEAIGNLIKNSVEHTPENGQISVSGYETPLTAVMTVADNGSGIPKESLPKIFDRFYSVSKKGSNTNSVGIGLAITKSIIERHNGSITAASDGKGTVFTITFLRG